MRVRLANNFRSTEMGVKLIAEICLVSEAKREKFSLRSRQNETRFYDETETAYDRNTF